jgi:hypothetical protein
MSAAVLNRRQGKKPRRKVVAASSNAGATVNDDAKSSLSEEYLFHSDGRRERVLALDANSSSFTADLTLLFEKNVARVRRAHKKTFGTADRAHQK